MSFLRGFVQRKTSQVAKDFITGVHHPWLPGEIAIIKYNIMLELGELCEVFEKAGFNRTRVSLSKKRVQIARQLILLNKEKKVSSRKPEEIDVETGKPVMSDAEIEQAKGRAQSDAIQPLVGEKRADNLLPNHPAVNLLRTMGEQAKKSKAAFVILLQDDGSLVYDGSGVTSKEILWAIERMKNILMHQDYFPTDYKE